MNQFDDSGTFGPADLPRMNKQAFDPYECNGGSLIAIAGEDFALLACDTRLTNGSGLCTRDQNKLFQLTPVTALGSVGCWADSLAIINLVKRDVDLYRMNNSRHMSTDALANMLSILMYNRRFFPYYTSTIVAGLDRNGKGAVYFYDPIGHRERLAYRAAGTAFALMLPAMDYHMKNLKEPLTIEKGMEIIHDVMRVAEERDVFTGDSAIVYIITKDGIKGKTMKMRKD